MDVLPKPRSQLERVGYLVSGRQDQAPVRLMFNRTAELRDAWTTGTCPRLNPRPGTSAVR